MGDKEEGSEEVGEVKVPESTSEETPLNPELNVPEANSSNNDACVSAKEKKSWFNLITYAFIYYQLQLFIYNFNV